MFIRSGGAVVFDHIEWAIYLFASFADAAVVVCISLAAAVASAQRRFIISNCYSGYCRRDIVIDYSLAFLIEYHVHMVLCSKVLLVYVNSGVY